MKRSPIRSRRATPRRRLAPQWTAADWKTAEPFLQARAGGRCECCGDPLTGPVERHHRVRRRDGGDRLSNLLVLLRTCHAYWTQHPEEARANGIILSVGQDPATCPVLVGDRDWMLLDDEGGLRPF